MDRKGECRGLGQEPVRNPMRLKCRLGEGVFGGISPTGAGSWQSVKDIGQLGVVGSHGGILCEREGMARFAFQKGHSG